MKFTLQMRIMIVVAVIALAISLVISQIKTPFIPDWMIQYTYYALMTAGLGFIFLGVLSPWYRDYLKESRLKRIQIIDRLTAVKGEYHSCAWRIKSNLDKYIEKNEVHDWTTNLSARDDLGEELEISKELKLRVQEYVEGIKDFNFYLQISERFVKEFIEKRTNQMFPKTIEKYDELPVVLSAKVFMEKYLEGEKVTTNWLKDSEPLVLRNINKQITRGERNEIDIFFNEANNEFQKSEALFRFRRTKKEIMKKGQEIIKALKAEAQLLENEIEKDSHLLTKLTTEKETY